MNYGIVLFPSKPLQDRANALRMRYDTHYSFIPPHITMKESFEMTETELPEIVATLRRIASQMKPASVHIYKFDTFNPLSNTVFMKISPHETLTNLYDALHRDPFSPNEKYGFIPHVTVGQDLSNDELADVYGRLKMREIEHTETIDRMQLVYQLENGSWTVYETFPLGKEE